MFRTILVIIFILPLLIYSELILFVRKYEENYNVTCASTIWNDTIFILPDNSTSKPVRTEGYKIISYVTTNISEVSCYSILSNTSVKISNLTNSCCTFLNVGQDCNIPCKDLLENTELCKRQTICDERNGCSCSWGFEGEDCLIESNLTLVKKSHNQMLVNFFCSKYNMKISEKNCRYRKSNNETVWKAVGETLNTKNCTCSLTNLEEDTDYDIDVNIHTENGFLEAHGTFKTDSVSEPNPNLCKMSSQSVTETTMMSPVNERNSDPSVGSAMVFITITIIIVLAAAGLLLYFIKIRKLVKNDPDFTYKEEIENSEVMVDNSDFYSS